ncbi:MAG: penicillin-binding protein 1C [Desulfarculus sp.]|nr:penicillin-binding protein 1C [Desulfarculus sp.]
MKGVHRGLLLAGASLALAPLLLWGLAVLGPGQLPQHGYGPQVERRVLAGDGQILASLTHPERRAGPWLAAGEIPPLVRAAALAAEDRRFHDHPGVDPVALARAAWRNLLAGRVVQGGSTITMQVARLESPSRRSMGAKLKEAARALWLEARLGKDEVLCQYLNRAPFGGPLVGIVAASRELLGATPQRLAPQEAALLMALPQDPSRLLQPANRPRLQARRDAILRGMAMAGALDAPALARALAAPLEMAPAPPPPPAAPHFAAALASRLEGQAPEVIATDLDPTLQQALADLVRQACRERQSQGLRQAAVLVLRNRDRAVLAWVGSQDFRGPLNGQVDGVLARRQPGSALKPFIYALALEQGRTLASRVADEPLSRGLADGAYRPVDYDGQHRGLVSLRVALASSLNLPALRLVEELTPAAVLERLRLAGLGLPREASHYGLGLALGDGEVSLLELTQAYAALASGGLWSPARLWQGQEGAPPRRAFSEAVAGLVTSVLADDQARAAGFGRHGLLELPFPTAVKTGTSQQHRDNWCLGYTSDYTVGVWAGNFEGLPMRGISGVSGAAPLWRQVMLYLHRQEPGRLPAPPAGLVRHQVCAGSGTLAGPACPAAMEELFLASAPPSGPCPLHAPRLEAAAPASPALCLVTPAPEAVYALDPDLDPSLQVLACRAAAAGPVSRASWLLNGRELPPGPDPLRHRVPLSPGHHLIEVLASGPGGRQRAVARFTVLAP